MVDINAQRKTSLQAVRTIQGWEFATKSLSVESRYLSRPETWESLSQNIKNHIGIALNGRKWISVDATDLFKLQILVVQLSTELFDFQPSLV